MTHPSVKDGKITMPREKIFWNAYFGMVTEIWYQLDGELRP